MKEEALQEVVRQAKSLRRDDGKLLHGTTTFKMAVVERDWQAVQEMALQQYDSFHGTPSLDADDLAFLRSEAAKDGFEMRI